VAPRYLIGGTVPRGTRDCRSLVTPDSDPGSSLSRASRDRVRGNDDGQDAHPTEDCFGLGLSQWHHRHSYQFRSL